LEKDGDIFMMKKLIFFIVVFLALASLAFAEYKLDEDINMLENDISNATNTNSTYFYQNGSLVIDASSVSYTSDTNASTECSSGEYLDGALGCVNFNDTVDAQDVIYNTTQTTYTDAQDVIYNTTMTTYVNAEDIVYNTTMTTYVDAQNVIYNTSQTSYANALNVSMTAFVNAMDVIYNTTMTTYVNLMNATMTTYVDAQDVIYNTTMTTYANLLNSTMTTYVDAQDVIYNTTMTAYADLHCALAGCTMAGDIAMGNNDITGVDDLNATEVYQNNNLVLDTADSFSGDVSGTYDATVVADDSHTHAYQNITNEPWIEDSQESSLDVNNSNSTDYWDSTATADDFVNITASGYILGQPLHGIVNKGILFCDEYVSGIMNVTDNGTHVFYPAFTGVFRDENDSLVICEMPAGNLAMPFNSARIAIVNSTCDAKLISTTEYLTFSSDNQRISRMSFAYILSDCDSIELLYGEPQAGDLMQMIRLQSIYVRNLKVISGMDINEGVFPELTQTAGVYVFDVHLAEATAQNSTSDGIELTYHSDSENFTCSSQTGINLTHCDNGTALISCSNNQFRRYLLYTIGHDNLVDRTKIHQLAAVDSESFANIGSCLDIEATPISYTLPTEQIFAAVTTHIYCGSRDDSSFSGGWIDLRAGIAGFGATVDTSVFLTKDGARPLTGNWDVGAFSITALSYTSDVTTGTAPLVVTSTTQVANLNVSYAGTAYDLTCTDCVDDTELAYNTGQHLTTTSNPTFNNVTATYFIGNGSQLTGMGSGTVTSIATTAPIAGGTITTTGTISLTACADTEIYKYNGTSSAWECEADASAGTYYFNLTADSGTVQQIDSTNVVDIAGGTNGIDTVVGATDTVTINLDWSEVANDAIAEAKIDMDTTCGAGNHLYVNGNDFACEADDDTTYSAGNGISEAATVFSVAGNTALTQDADGLSVTADAIGDTQLAFNTGQHLTSTTGLTFATVDTGNGAYELFAMNQDVESTDAVTFATIDTGIQAMELTNFGI
jgi:hypothetical protein